MKFEPVAILDGLKYLLLVLSTLGVAFLDEPTQQAIVGAVGAAFTLYATWETRRRVTPVAKLDPR